MNGVKQIFDSYYYKRNDNGQEHSGDTLSRKINTQFLPLTGIVTINSVPTSLVNIDGQNYGSTPITVESLAVGTHELTLTGSGCTPLTKTISVKEGEETTYNLQLPRACRLTIVSDENNDVAHIDNEYVGRTPVTVELPFGSHTIMLIRTGKFQLTKEIELNPEEPELTLQLFFGKRVNVEAGNKPHRLYLDGEYSGRTPSNQYLSLGTHTLRAERGWKIGEKTVNIEEDKSIDLIHIDTYYEKPKALLANGAFFMTGNMAFIKTGQPVYGFNIGDIANGGQFGWYFSFITNGTFINQLVDKDFSLFNAWMSADENGNPKDFSRVNYSGEKATMRASATFGVLLRVVSPVYFRIGAGAGIRHHAWKTLETDDWVVIDPYSWKGVEATLGLQCCLYNFVINADVMIPQDLLTKKEKLVEFRIGFGYFLKHKRAKRQ